VRTAGKLVRFLDVLVLVARSAAIALVVALVGGCPTYACPGTETANQAAVFRLSCGPTDLVSVVLSGPCSVGDAGSSSYLFGPENASLAVSSPSAGVCHVTLTFATGFTYAADVTFTLQSQNDPPGCPVWHYTTPTQPTFVVNNPGSTCVDAGLDARGDGPADGASQVACPSDASQSVACAMPGSCTGCRFNAQFECTCTDVDSGSDGSGLQWQCMDTGFPCPQGGP